MKNLRIIVITVIIILTLAACGKQATGGNSEVTTGKTTEVSSPATTTDGTITAPVPDAFVLPHEFTATDLFGNTVNQETFGEKQVFFIHYWATWCPPCINEMPELAAIAGKYGDRAGFIGLVDDFDTNSDGAVRIIESAGVPATFIMLDANESSVAALREAVNSGFLPTTVLLTKDGFSEQIIGAKGEEYATFLDEILA